MPNEINLFGVIGDAGLTAADIKSQLAAFDQDELLVARFDSSGGSVFAGMAIFSAFRDYPGPKKAIVESAAFSIASYLLTAFDEVEITDNGYLMIHNPSIASDGDDEDHARDAKLLAELKQDMVREYARKMGLPEDRVLSLMKAETFFTAEESVANGLADKILSFPTASRVAVGFKDTLPYRVVASLRGDAASGDTPKPVEKPMAEEQKPVAATVAEIKAAFPNAKSDFIVRCLEKQMPIASVAAAAAEELLAENEALQAKITAMEEEQEAAKAKAQEEEEAAKAKAKAEADAKAKAAGNQPVATGANVPKGTARQRWTEAVTAGVKDGLPRAKAVQRANRTNPGLREEMLAEINAA